MWRGTLTPRKASVLALRLPPGARVWRDMGSDAAWTVGEHLTAALIDVAQIANWQRGGDNKAKRPTPIRRPSDGPPADARAEREMERARAFAERQRLREAWTETTEET